MPDQTHTPPTTNLSSGRSVDLSGPFSTFFDLAELQDEHDGSHDPEWDLWCPLCQDVLERNDAAAEDKEAEADA